jgi:hypothetical protein
MGWVVALADLQGLRRADGVFLRTPKSASTSKVVHALRVTWWEGVIGGLCAAVALALVVLQRPLQAQSVFLAGLLGWQSSLYLSAPLLSLLSAFGARPVAPSVPLARPMREPGRPAAENNLGQIALAAATLVALLIGFAQLLPRPARPSYSIYRPPEIPAQNLVPGAPTPTATPPGATPTAEPTAAPIIPPLPTIQLPVILPTAAPTITPTVTPVVTATATLTATAPPLIPPIQLPPLPGLSPTPTATPTITPTLTPTPTPLAPAPALPGPPAAGPIQSPAPSVSLPIRLPSLPIPSSITLPGLPGITFPGIPSITLPTNPPITLPGIPSIQLPGTGPIVVPLGPAPTPTPLVTLQTL